MHTFPHADGRSLDVPRLPRFQLELVTIGTPFVDAGDSCKKTCTVTCKMECHSGAPVMDEIYEEAQSFPGTGKGKL